MKRKLFTLLIPAMMVGCLAGCGGKATDYNKFCADAADTVALLLNSDNGKEIFASDTMTREMADYNSVLGINAYTYKEKELKFDWQPLPADKWVSSPYVLDNSRTKFAPVYGDADYEASLKCTVSYAEDGKELGKKEFNWRFDVKKATAVEKTLKEINDEFVANGNDLGDLASGNIATRGIITATFEEPDHIYAGVYIQDGDYALQLYAGKLSSLWAENGFKVGDCVFCVGPLSPYGAVEMKPNLMEVIDAAAYNITAPTELDLTDQTWSVNDNLVKRQSCLAKIEGLVYKEGNITSVTMAGAIKFLNGSTEVEINCNYHLGPTAMKAIKELVEGYTTSTTVTIRGILGFDKAANNGPDKPNLIPIFGVNSFVAEQ